MATASGLSGKNDGVKGKYSKIDEYGFIRGEDFDYKSYENFMSEYTGVLVRRKSRWNQFLGKKKNPKVKLDNKVKRFCRKGIPMERRKLVWMSVSGAQKKLDKNPGLYECTLAREDGSEKDEDLKCAIKTDIERTFPDNIHFRSGDRKATGRLPSLEKVLLAIGRYKSDIGYCQGMSYVAALLLLVLDDEESVFWLFVTALEDILPDYYSLNLTGVRVDMDVLGELVKERFPRVALALENESVNWQLISSKWFICLYADVLPTETVMRIWDCLFTEGTKILFRVALKLIKIRADKVREAEDMPAIIAAFQNIGKEDIVLECHAFMQECFEEEIPLRRAKILELRAICREKIEKEDAEIEERKRKRQQQQ